ncbi:uncharacterized protein LOC133359160 isoform X3 [Lethenteron reissneri]|uniref:uncharacterized protein LOC133359160 isoform X3 n=1 Tax=Lethenteron reissneri TaxID=7753 RepID=UPI002AB5FE67|nr:uncharacterized protein LOC133359160 isoform X3 [Lethenteron reissneri]
MAEDKRFKKKTEQVRILLDDLKNLPRFDNSTIPTLLRMSNIRDPYNVEERSVLAKTFHKEGGIELFMKLLTSVSPDASNVPDSLWTPMEWGTKNVLAYIKSSDPEKTFVDCGGLKFLLSLLKHHACQGLVLRFESRNTLRFAVTTLANLSEEVELKSCFHQELAADVLACYLDVPDAPCKLSALSALARITTEQDLDIICNAKGAISLLTDMVNRTSYKDFILLENILYSSKRLVETLTMISITAGIRRKTLQPGAELDQEALQEILPKLREKLKVETERRDYRLEWGDIAFPRNRIFREWPKSENGKVYVPYKVSLAFFDGDIKKIEEAALEFKKKTCVRFIPRSNETDYIYIHAWEGNWSFLGCKGRDQALSLDPGKVTKGVVLHEFMHALGFYHEHSRSDRDKYILVLSDNIKPEWKDAMVKTILHDTNRETNTTTPYDYSSITHYGMTAGSKDEHSPTMLPRDTSTMRRFGGGHTLSDGDVEKIEKMFDSEPAPRGRRGAFLNQQNVSAGAGPVLRDVGVSDYSLVEVVEVWNQLPKEIKENKVRGAFTGCGVSDRVSAKNGSRWPQDRNGNVYIPYKVSSDFYDCDVETITRALQEFGNKTCVHFKMYSMEKDFIHIQALDGPLSKSWSLLGKQGGGQPLSLEPGKVTKGVVLHEFMHALGFHHEHCRSDRDDHVFVLSDNVKPEWKCQMVKMESNPQDLSAPYDYNSILHYSMTAGSVDERNPTIIPKNPLLMLHMGHGNSLSPCDVAKVQKLYGYEVAAQTPSPPLERPSAPAGTRAEMEVVARSQDMPLHRRVGLWRKKTEEEINEEKKEKENNLEMKVKTVERMIENTISVTSFDESTITSLECLHEMLSADGPEEETAALHLAFKGNGGPELLIKIMDSPKPRDLRIPLLDLLTKISSAMAIHDSGMDSRDKNEMDEAFGEFQEKTCVRFVARKQELDYINFQALGGSWSFLGKKGGAQSVSLEPGKVDRGTVLHELMHALGFHHEHCRSDRDDHVHIHEDNIKESDLCQFKRLELSERDYGLPYDYISITHNSRHASSIDGVSPTIVPVQDKKTPIGQRDFLSPLDVLKIQRMFQGPVAASGRDEALEKALAETVDLMQSMDETPSELLRFLAEDMRGPELKKKVDEVLNIVKELKNLPSCNYAMVELLERLKKIMTFVDSTWEEKFALKTAFVKNGGPEMFEKIRTSASREGSGVQLQETTKFIEDVMKTFTPEQKTGVKDNKNLLKKITSLKKLSKFDFTVVQPLIYILNMLSVEHTIKEKVDVKEAFLRQGGAELLKKIQDTPTQDDSEIPLQIVTEIMFQMLMTYTVDVSAKLEKEIEDIYTDLIPLMTFASFDHSTVKALQTIWNKLNAVLSVEKRLLAKAAFLRAGGPELFKEMQKCLQSDAVENGLLEVMMDIYTLMMDFTFTSIQAHHENEDTFPEPEEIKARKRRHVFKDILRRVPRPSRRRHHGAPSRTGTDGVIGGTHTQSE